MFGYIKVFKPELRFKDFAVYRNTYCCLCKSIGTNYGLPARAILSYDATFMLIIFLGLSSKIAYAENRQRRDCIRNKKSEYVNDDIYKATAGASILLAQNKIYDNIYDSKFLKKAFYKIAKKFFSRSYKNAQKDFPDLDKIISNFMDKQIFIEKNNKISNIKDITIFSEPTSIMLSEMFLYISQILNLDEDQQQLIEKFGYNLGRWVYFIDALDDVKIDKNKGEFNPILSCDFNNNMIEYINKMLNECIINMTRSYNEMHIYGYYEIIENVLNFGLRYTQSVIINKFQHEFENNII